MDSSVTLLSLASLLSLHQEITPHSLEDIQLRFIANIELVGVDPYWKESLTPEHDIEICIAWVIPDAMNIELRKRHLQMWVFITAVIFVLISLLLLQ